MEVDRRSEFPIRCHFLILHRHHERLHGSILHPNRVGGERVAISWFELLHQLLEFGLGEPASDPADEAIPIR
jgi:hypothetical protein